MRRSVKDILDGIEIERVLNAGDMSAEVRGLSFDSRKLAEGDVFVALKGTGADGHRFLDVVVKGGVTAIVVEAWPQNLPVPAGCTVVKVADTHRALGLMASNFYGRPSHKLTVIGVTGTNGKTTIATLLYKMALKMGVKSGLISTIANYIGEERFDATHTTPDAVSINRLMAEMVERGCRFVAMEVSSHAAHQKRIAGIRFSGGVFTNLTRDHLDYHGTVTSYRDAKKLFFDGLSKESFALVNIDDPNGMFMLQNCKARKYTYSLLNDSDFHSRIIEKHIDSTLISIDGNEVETMFSGVYNIYNLTAVYGSLILAGFDKEETLIALSQMKPVDGRFQTLRSPGNITAVIDYAHTPDALKNVLDAIREVKKNESRVITVTGAGGDRDKGKRPEMGLIAATLSDRVIFTSDNPRSEEPESIIIDMMAGLSQEDIAKTLVITDRRQAIRTAVALGAPGDILLIAGKGHEDYQEIKGVRHHFNDLEEVKKIFYNI